MSNAIWKYELAITDEQIVEMPKGSALISVADQHGTGRTLQLWAMVYPGAEREERRILIFGTGHPVPPSLRSTAHIGSVVTQAGGLVWHVFDGGRRR